MNGDQGKVRANSRKAMWRGNLDGSLPALQPKDKPYLLAARLDREPDRVVQIRVTDRKLALVLAQALLLWAEETA
jgi:hypothetical protein